MWQEDGIRRRAEGRSRLRDVSCGLCDVGEVVPCQSAKQDDYSVIAWRMSLVSLASLASLAGGWVIW